MLCLPLSIPAVRRDRGRLILWFRMLVHVRRPFMVVMLGAMMLRTVFMLRLFTLRSRSWSPTVVMMLLMMMSRILWVVLMSMIMPIMMWLMLRMVSARLRALLVM